jgi:hypothetical protein
MKMTFDRVYQMLGIQGFEKKVESFKNKTKEQSEKRKQIKKNKTLYCE